MHQLTGTRIRPQGTPPGKKRKLTFPPVIGTLESNQQRRAMLIANKRAAQHSTHLTAFRRGMAVVLFVVIVLPAVALIVIGGR